MDIITVKSYYVGDCILEIESKLSQWNELQGNEWNGEEKWKQKKTDIVNQDENHWGNLVNGDDDAQLLLAKRR